jgi:hypothetical protein
MESKPEMNIDMLVLDAIQDDVEQLPTIMRMLAEWRPQLDEEYTDDDAIEALARLMSKGLVGALEESVDKPELVRISVPNTSRAALRQYWYEPTARGRAMWKSWNESMDEGADNPRHN